MGLSPRGSGAETMSPDQRAAQAATLEQPALWRMDADVESSGSQPQGSPEPGADFRLGRTDPAAAIRVVERVAQVMGRHLLDFPPCAS